MLADDSVILTGNFRLTGQPTTYSLLKLTPAGTLDTSFSPGPQNSARPSRPAVVTNVRVAPDGKLWVLGRFDTIGGKPAPGVARLNPDGTLDSTFQLTDVGYYDSFGDAADVVFANGATAYLVGTFRRPGEPIPFAVTRILGPPLITSPLTATGTVGQRFVYQFQTQGATSLGVTNLPPGLTFNSGLAAIVGTPTASGTAQVGLSASNSVGTTTATLVLTIQPPPPSGPVITSSTSATGRVRKPFNFQVITIGGSPATRISASGLPNGLTLDSVTGVISGTPTTEASSAVTLTATDGNLTATAALQLTFASDPGLPVIISPSTATISPGQAFSYTISAPATAASGDVTTFTLIGTLPVGLSFDAKTGTISGVYSGASQTTGDASGQKNLSGGVISNVQIFATNSHGTSTTPLVFFLAPTGAVNISTRLAVGTADNVLIGGFIVTGNAPKKVVVRAIAPSLKVNGVPVPGTLRDPVLELYDVSRKLLGSNDDWRTNQEQEIIDTTVPPAEDRESATVATLNPGNYTAIVRGKGTDIGIGLVEVYDLGTASLDSSASSKLAQISTRGTVQSGDNVMIGGFIISGATTKVIVRAIGPELTAAGVAGALQDTTLEIRDGSGSLITENDDWQSAQEQAIKDTGVPPTDPRESAVVASLMPGGYTAIVRGKNGTTGVALVEVYGLQ